VGVNVRVPMTSQFGGAAVACILHPLEVNGQSGMVGVVCASKDSVTTTVSSTILTLRSSEPVHRYISKIEDILTLA